jgi:hypothetical protein
LTEKLVLENHFFAIKYDRTGVIEAGSSLRLDFEMIRKKWSLQTPIF